jgi:D-alanine-D-alanine ligase
MYKVLIIAGGVSSEHEISLVSAATIVRNIDKKNYTVYIAGITKDGCWYLQSDDEVSRLCADKNAALKISTDRPMWLAPPVGFLVGKDLLEIDIVFPALHGRGGEDGRIQGLLESFKIAYVGCDIMSSSIAMDKEKTKALWSNRGLPVVPGKCLRRWELTEPVRLQQVMESAEAEFGYPMFVKPCKTGSSVATAKVSTRDELRKAIKTAFKWDHKVMIEQAINAREIECAMLGDFVLSGKLSLCGFGEVVPHHEFYDYDAKYNDPNGAELILDPVLSDAEKRGLIQLATQAYTTLECSGLARIDFFLDKDSDCAYLNEINTMPGFTPISMFPSICAHVGMTMSELIDTLILSALNRRIEDYKLYTDLFGPPPPRPDFDPEPDDDDDD